MYSDTAQQLTSFFAEFPEVESVALSGSHGAGRSDHASDLDLYVYVASEIPPERRRRFIEPRAARFEIDNRFWETGDEWIEKSTHIAVDAMYRAPVWIEAQLQRVLERHEASVGYSTCFWSNVLYSEVLFDRNGWYAGLKKSADRPYPEALRRAIIRKNYPVLRSNISSYREQISKAMDRGDLTSVHHRRTAFLASWFDILFAVNRIPHPGEKRLLDIAESRCEKKPQLMRSDLIAFLKGEGADVLTSLDRLTDSLEDVLSSEGLL